MDNRRLEFDDEKGDELKFNFSSTEKSCLDRHLKMKPTSEGEQNENYIQLRAGLLYNATKEPLIIQPVQHAAINLSNLEAQADLKYQKAFRSFNPYLPAPFLYSFSRWERLEIADDNCDSDGKAGCDPDLKLKVETGFEDAKGETTRYSLFNYLKTA